ncbi:MAG TPA: glucoamylase family protein [Streptosporangiaceae bacterium]|nr:glucoamylase family protein [Streptosporangiaceae bacterium]
MISSRRLTRRTCWLGGAAIGIAVIVAAMLAPAQQARADGAGGYPVANYSGLSQAQQANLLSIARDTWKFYDLDVDPATNLPMDNMTFAGGSVTPTTLGHYTSAADIGVYLWAVVSARDLGIISEAQADARIRATLTEVSHLQRYDGFLYQWYDTTNGDVLSNPGQADCAAGAAPAFTNCFFVSNVDNGWYASGLIVVREAMPELAGLANSLIAPMNFSIFYDNRAETQCNTNPAIPGNQPTGQMFGGYYVGLPPYSGNNYTEYYHNGALYSDPRISAYIGMGLHQMPGNVWWRSWRELPPKAPFADCQSTDPDFSWQGQWPMGGYWQTYTDPQSGQQFDVWEGHYTYPGTNLTFIPTYGGGMFEAMMPNIVVPETSWGTRSFGLADVRTVQVQIKYATQQLGYKVWGMSPSSTADDTGDYAAYGVEGLAFPYYGTGADASHPNDRLAQCQDPACDAETVVTPYASFIALDVAPQQAYANIEALRTDYPGLYGPAGFYDAVNPVTGAIGQRDLVLDQSMIMASLDNALNNRAIQRDFARDPVSWAAHEYLSIETMSIAG